MDLVTQVVLGAAVGEVVLGKKAGNKAILWGAIGGLIPDLDVLITPFFNDVDGLFVHRGFSHSVVFSFILAPLIGWLAYIIHQKNINASKFDWIKLLFWATFTHPILDYMTTYGTGAFWPFSDYRVEFSNVGIVDLFYTLPLILVLAVIMFINRSSQLRRKLIMSVVFLTTAYLGATAVNKLYVNSVFKNAFAEKNIEYERFKTSALPLSNFLWMGLAETDSGYYMGLYSNFDSEKPQEFMFIDRNHDKLQGFAQDEGLHKLIQFTKGWYHVGEDKNGLYLVDLRFGKAGLDENADYIFKFNIKETANSLIITQSKESRNIEPKAFKAFIDRIKGI
jgi:inner membrane protein